MMCSMIWIVSRSRRFAVSRELVIVPLKMLRAQLVEGARARFKMLQNDSTPLV